MNLKASPQRAAAAAAVAALIAVAVVAGGAQAASRSATANTVTFEASPGPDPAAPAISSVTVSNDDDGLVTFQIAMPNRPAWSNDMDLSLFLDTDQNAQTGAIDYSGAEYMIDLSFNSVDLASWTGSEWHFMDQSPASLIWSYGNGAATIKVKAADVASTITGFNFYAAVLSGMTGTISNPDYSGAHYDFAPALGHGDWTYAIKVTPLQISVAGFKTTPKQPKAGQPFSASMTVSSTIPATLARDAQLVCTAKLGGKTITARAQGISNGHATCSWQLPRSGKKKRLTGSVVVSVQGLQVTKSFAVTVR